MMELRESCRLIGGLVIVTAHEMRLLVLVEVVGGGGPTRLAGTLALVLGDEVEGLRGWWL